jgi:hypothetical protein
MEKNSWQRAERGQRKVGTKQRRGDRGGGEKREN